MILQNYPLLSKINAPGDLKILSRGELGQLADELRQYIIDIVSVNGGHFAASLGVVELTVALHYTYNSPEDSIVWDVGHQAYGHKILTGRAEIFHTNRKYKGLSGFPKRSESPHDAFGVGHSSTSISATLGMDIANQYLGQKEKKSVAIIGDGSMTAGLAFEALNHFGASNSNALVILNDNCMSIDPNVGALKKYLTSITSSELYNKFRNEFWDMMGKLPYGSRVQELSSKTEASLKGFISKSSNLFESLGIRYFGHIDGHNLHDLVKILKHLKTINGPKLLHVITTKGKGYKLAEQNQTKWHAPGLFDKDTGTIKKTVSPTIQPPKYQDVFGETIIELAKQNKNIVGITPAMPSGSSLKTMIEQMPDRAFDVGICEQHAVTISAGMATKGLKVFCNIYSSFMQRAYDQVIHDVVLQKLPVIFCLDRAGLVGEDGPTHHGCYDVAYMRCLPNIIVSAPMNEAELRNLMFTAQLEENNLPFVIRYPRGKGVMPEWRKDFKKIEIGKGIMIREGENIAILSFGHVGNFVVDACNQLEDKDIYPAHYDMRFVKPLDEELLHKIFKQFNHIITIEDGTKKGGFGSAILEFMAENDYQAQVKILGIPDKIVEHGKPEELHKECYYDADSIAQAVIQICDKKLATF